MNICWKCWFKLWCSDTKQGFREDFAFLASGRYWFSMWAATVLAVAALNHGWLS